MDKRVKRTIRDIHETTVRLCEDIPVSELTFSKIADEAGYSRGTLYQHYRNVEDLIRAVEAEKVKGLIHAFRKPYVTGTPPAEGAYRYHPDDLEIFMYIHNEQRFFTLVMSNSDFAGFRDHLIELFIDMFTSDLDYLVKDLNGFVKERFVEVQSYSLFGLIAEWVRRDYQEPVTEMNEQLIRAFFCHENQISYR